MKSFHSVEEFRDKEGILPESGLFEGVEIYREALFLSEVHESRGPGPDGRLTWEKIWKEMSNVWARYRLSPFPDCCGIVISHYSVIHDKLRGLGLGDFFHKERLSLMKQLGYSCAMATVVSTNEAEKHILEKNGWKKIHEFNNRRTGNTVEIWVKDV